VITALEALEAKDRPIQIFSDSQYTLNGITKGWARTWRRNSWKKSDGQPAKNADLWERLLNLVDTFPNLTFQWVRGHAGNRLNETADTLANSAAQGSDLIEDTGYGDR
jgi:ribonuclease HI